MPAPAISIVIVNWNGGKVLPQCLETLTAQTFQDFEIILVDNGSTDGSTDDLETRWPQLHLKLIHLPNNAGFAAANNIGARAAQGEWLALLNNDAFPGPNWLETLLTASRQYPEYTFFASRLLQAGRPDIIDGTGDVYHVSGAVWNRQHNYPAHLAVNQPGEVFSPQGAAALFPRVAFLEVGGFDESYHSYHEDIDLAFRLRLRGHRCLYIPDALVYHKGSFTTGKGSDFAVLHGHRNLVWCYFQNMPGWLIWRYLPDHLLANLFTILHIASKGQTKAILTAKWNALRGLPRIIRKRKEIQRSRTATHAEILSSMDRKFLSPYTLGLTSRRLKRQLTNPSPPR